MRLIDFADADVLAGGSGWAGAGMPGCVLGWLLLRHIPSLTDSHVKLVQQLSSDFKEFLEKVTKHYEAEIANLTADWKREIDRIVLKIEETQAKVLSPQESRRKHYDPPAKS